jgi:acyl transferase domain-containing protein
MDPEIRLQLETTYEALENAGMPLEQVAGSKTGVFAGTCFRDNHDNHMRDPDGMNDPFFLTGNGAAMVANRISHFYDLRGPSIMVDTGCSTTLTLLHLACQSLRGGEASMAVVGGSALNLNPEMFIAGTKIGHELLFSFLLCLCR